MNPYTTCLVTDSPDGAEIEVVDTRTSQGVRWFGVQRCGGIAEATRAAEAWAAGQWVAEAAEAVPALTPAPVAPVIPAAPGSLTPNAAQIEAALLALEENARRSRRLCAADGDREGAQIARRSERAYRDAAGDLRMCPWVLTARGDILIASSSRRNVWHRVGRRPVASDSGFSPIVCSCDHGRKSSGLGPCRHAGFFEGVELAQQAMVAEADAAAEADARAAFGLAAD